VSEKPYVPRVAEDMVEPPAAVIETDKIVPAAGKFGEFKVMIILRHSHLGIPNQLSGTAGSPQGNAAIAASTASRTNSVYVSDIPTVEDLSARRECITV